MVYFGNLGLFDDAMGEGKWGPFDDAMTNWDPLIT